MEEKDQNCVDECKINMGKLIQMVSHQLKRRNVSPAANGELTNIQRNILGYILMNSIHRDVFQKELEEEFHIRKSTVTGILQLMEKNGFIAREPVPSDARQKKIVPTPKAEAYRGEVLAKILKIEERLAKGIPEEDYKTCKRVLLQMLRTLKEDEKE